MMIEPSISSLMEKTEDRFTLCIIAGKRARQIINGAHKLAYCDSKNAVTIAATEIDANKIAFIRTKSGIK